MSYHYGVPPQHYTKFYDSASPHSSGEYVQYVPYQYDYTTPVKGHRRKTSHTPVTSRVGGWFSPAGSPPPGAERYSFNYNVSPTKDAYVSYERKRASSSTKPPTRPQPRTVRKPSQPVNVYDGDDVYVRDHYVEDREPLPTRSSRPTKSPSKHGKKPSTDSYFYRDQEQIYEEQQQQKPRTTTTRVRRSSTTTKSSPRKERTSVKAVPVATEEDAARAGIPTGYSIKNWDPTEEPIILLGSVFDANSLGKWVYDWTVYKCGASTPMAEMAGDLWLLLIKLAGKMKRAKECVLRVKREEQREMIYEFIEGGQRMWKAFKQLLKDCEYFMMKAAKKQGSVTLMGKNAGTEFVESIFGRERYLETTERLMNRLRVWTMRFDVNCEDIIRRPSGRAE